MGRARVLVVVAALVLVAVACDWSQPGGGPTHANFNSSETSFTTDNVDEIEPDWLIGFDVIQGTSLLSWGNHVAVTTATSGGSNYAVLVFAADGTSCNGSACTAQWRLPPAYLTTAVDGPTMFATTMVDAVHARLAAFDANGVQGCAGSPKTCAPLWTATWNATSAGTPVIADGRVYVAGGGSTQVFDAKGTAGCSAATCNPLFSLLGADGTPSVDGGLAFSATASDILVFDATGTTCAGPCLPIRHLATGGSPSGAAIGNGFVYTQTSTGLVVFDQKPAAPCPGTPATCAPRWTAPGITGAQVVTDTAVFVTSAGTLRAVDALGSLNCGGTPKTCSTIWQGSVPGFTFRNHPAATKNILFVDAMTPSGDVKVVAFDVQGTVGCGGTPKTCTPLWSSNPVGDAFPLSLIAANSRVFWAYRDFGLIAVKLPA